MKNSLKTLTLAMFSALLIASPVKAQGIPVIDAAGIAQTVIQIQEMARDYQKQIEQLDTALSTYNSLTGGRNIGDLLNSTVH